jgi:hypothetical protein
MLNPGGTPRLADKAPYAPSKTFTDERFGLAGVTPLGKILLSIMSSAKFLVPQQRSPLYSSLKKHLSIARQDELLSVN